MSAVQLFADLSNFFCSAFRKYQFKNDEESDTDWQCVRNYNLFTRVYTDRECYISLRKKNRINKFAGITYRFSIFPIFFRFVYWYIISFIYRNERWINRNEQWCRSSRIFWVHNCIFCCWRERKKQPTCF